MKHTLFLSMLALAGISQATVILDRGMTTGGYGGSWGNQSNSQNFADNFTLGNDAVVQTYRLYGTFSPGTLAGNTAVVRLYDTSAAAFAPGNLLDSQTIAYSASALVGNFSGVDVYSYDFVLNTPWNLTGGVEYWAGAAGDAYELTQVSLKNPAPDDGLMAQFGGNGYGNNTSVGDQAFQLDGQGVPEPVSMVVFGVGAMALLRRRRAR